MDLSPWGSFTLVTYVPEPLGSFLDGLRQNLPSDEQAPAHITILPPRLLSAPLGPASCHAANVLSTFSEFEVELATLCCFPTSRIHYLGIAEGNETIHKLHAALNTGELAGEEQYQFLPHLTLGGSLNKPDAEEAEIDRAWNHLALRKTFTVRKIVGLWATPQDGQYGKWTRVRSYDLQKNQQKSEAATGRTS